MITVGASENVQSLGGTDACGIGDAGADNANDVIGFSSRGPTADGRIKPEIIAPGTHITGGVGQASIASPTGSGSGAAIACFNATGVCAGPGTSDFFPVGQQWYTSSDGTSHSTPAIAGYAALIRQHHINQALTPPSPAMTKAMMMNSARYLTGVGANDNLYSNTQGWVRRTSTVTSISSLPHTRSTIRSELTRSRLPDSKELSPALSVITPSHCASRLPGPTLLDQPREMHSSIILIWK